MRESTLTPEHFPHRRRVMAGEGGAVYTAEHDGKFYIITDESVFADLLDEEDLRDMLVKVLEFDTAAERGAYLQKRGWRMEEE